MSVPRILRFCGVACVASLVAAGCRPAAPRQETGETRREGKPLEAASPVLREAVLVKPPAPDPLSHDGHQKDCPCLLLSPEAIGSGDGADLFDAWRKQEPGPAAAWLARLPAIPPVLAAVDRAVSAWSREEPAESLAWALSVENLDLRSRALSRIAASWIGRDGTSEPILQDEKLGEGAEREAAAVDLVAAWARVDPKSAAVWVESFPTGMLREAASSQLVRRWSEHDPKSAEAWRAANRP